MSNGDNFTMKEMILIVMDDLKDFRVEYDKNQQDLADKLAKRPTWGQMMSLLGGVGVIVTVVVSLVGG